MSFPLNIIGLFYIVLNRYTESEGGDVAVVSVVVVHITRRIDIPHIVAITAATSQNSLQDYSQEIIYKISSSKVAK